MFNNNDDKFNESNNGSSNNGNRGKFSERIARMRKNRNKKNNDEFVEDNNHFVNMIRNIFKVVIALPSIIVSNIKDTNNKSSDDNKRKISDDGVIRKLTGSKKRNIFDKVKSKHNRDENSVSINNLTNDIELSKNDGSRKLKVNKIREMNVSLLRLKKELDIKRYFVQPDNGLPDVNQKEIRIQSLQKEIINLLKKRLVDNINEFEMLSSELYLLKEINNEDIFLERCNDDIKEIKKLLSKIKTLKEKYDYLKDNIDFEYILEYNDDLLIDKILELKRLCTDDDVLYIVDNYKILDEYKYLYLKVDKLQENMFKYEEYKQEKVEELKQRDIDFEKLKNQVYDVDRENERYDSFVKEQELFLKSLNEKVTQIDSHERIIYRLKGFNQLLGNSFKYLGLLLLNPLKGFLPSIATHTIITKNTIHNLYNNLEIEEYKKMVYEAVDYSSEINRAINSLDSTASLIDTTLDEISRLKAEYKKKFSAYEYSVYGYSDAIKKLNKIENAVFGNKIKITKMQERMKEKERQNSSKMKLVKKLNTSNNS